MYTMSEDIKKIRYEIAKKIWHGIKTFQSQLRECHNQSSKPYAQLKIKLTNKSHIVFFRRDSMMPCKQSFLCLLPC